jgi:thiamine-phosphate pyrophosphorylase
MVLPLVYAIIDAEVLRARGRDTNEVASALRVAGVRLLQYRDKQGSDEDVLRAASLIAEVFKDSGATLLLNDRVHLVERADWHGVHIGQGDMPPAEARSLLGPKRILGLSTHNDEQVRQADRSAVDYIAIGPIFATSTKEDLDPVVGLDGLRHARELTRKPVVAIGGITRENARSVIDAGADSVAVISALFSSNEPTEKIARDFLERLR